VTDCAGRPLQYGKREPPQTGGIFAATEAAWRYARPIVVKITASMFEDEARGSSEHGGDSIST